MPLYFRADFEIFTIVVPKPWPLKFLHTHSISIASMVHILRQPFLLILLKITSTITALLRITSNLKLNYLRTTQCRFVRFTQMIRMAQCLLRFAKKRDFRLSLLAARDATLILTHSS